MLTITSDTTTFNLQFPITEHFVGTGGMGVRVFSSFLTLTVLLLLNGWQPGIQPSFDDGFLAVLTFSFSVFFGDQVTFHFLPLDVSAKVHEPLLHRTATNRLASLFSSPSRSRALD